MAQLLDYYENLPDAPPWFNKNQRKKLERQDPALPHAVRIYNAERTAFGPQAFTDNTLSVHLYTNGTRPWWREHVPLPGSYAARMCAEIGVDPALALEE